jgi:hypothetical protein
MNSQFRRLRAASISRKILAGNETYPRRHLAGHHLPIRDWNYVFAVTSQDLGPCQLKIRRHGDQMFRNPAGVRSILHSKCESECIEAVRWRRR